MAAAQAGDSVAYRALLEDVHPLLRAVLRRWFRDPEDLRDAVQETLMTLHRARHTYDPSRPFERWLAALARYTAADLLRRQMRRAAREVAFDVVREPPVASEAGETADLARALARLPPAQREAFAMLKLEGLSLAQAAARAGTSVGALKVRAHRAYKAIKAVLGR